MDGCVDIRVEEVPDRASVVVTSDWDSLGLVEITQSGRLQLAAALGLDATTATRYHGFTGYGRGQTGRRLRLLRTLAHTLGANAIFSAFAVAAEAARRAGGSDHLAEWRSAAACERRHCKPDGYGCYLRDGEAHGFFLEYDRGTESARKYAAKLSAYYRYRDSGQAARDYNGFPALLFVTTQSSAEQRIAGAAYRASFIRGTEALPVLITTVNRIAGGHEGILGPIWRTPAPIGTTDSGSRQYWLPGAPPRGAVRISVPRPRLVWSTTNIPRTAERGSLGNASGSVECRAGSPRVDVPADGPGPGEDEVRQSTCSRQGHSSASTRLNARRKPGDTP